MSGLPVSVSPESPRNLSEMPNAPRISVVLPVYNGEQHLNEAVGSILNQTFQDFELIIVDDGSTDATPAILEEFARSDGRIRLYKQTNSGLVASLNRLCRLARGAYIARMDADDISLPERFRRQTEYLDSHAEIGVAGTWIQDIGADGTLGPVWPLPGSPASIRWFLMFGNCIAHPSVMMRRELVERLGYYRPEAIHVEDYDLWMRVASVTGLANIPEVLLKYRVLSKSVSSRNLSTQHHQAVRLQCASIGKLLKHPVMDTQLSASDLLDLYDAFRRAFTVNRGDDAEIVLDIFRRLFLSRQLHKPSIRLLPLISRLLSIHAIRKTIRFGVSYARNFEHGFTTQRRVL